LGALADYYGVRSILEGPDDNGNCVCGWWLRLCGIYDDLRRAIFSLEIPAAEPAAWQLKQESQDSFRVRRFERNDLIALSPMGLTTLVSERTNSFRFRSGVDISARLNGVRFTRSRTEAA